MGKTFQARMALAVRACAVLLLLAVAAGGWMHPSPAQAAGIYFIESPQGTTGLSRPELRFTVTRTEVTADLIQHQLFLDGYAVNASFDPNTTTLRFTPDQDLAPGKHAVEAVLQYVGYQQFSEKWEFTVSESASDKQEVVISPEQEAGLRALNDFRVLYGLKPVEWNDALVHAAQLHAHYLNANQVDASKVSLHDEDPAGEGFIGKDIGERRNYVGYAHSLSEDVSYNTGTLIQSIDSLFDAPYHRTPFLEPSLSEVGLAKEGDYTVIEFGYPDREQADASLVVSPAPGDPGVPTTFDGHEVPDPLRHHPLTQYPVGYTLMGIVSGEDAQSVHLVDSGLTDSSGKSIELVADTPSNDEHLQHEIILVPLDPFKPDTGYTAHMTVEVTHADGTKETLEKKWIFRTEGSEGAGKQALHADAGAYAQRLAATDISRHVAAFALNGDSYTLDGKSYPMKAPYMRDGNSYLWVRDLAAALGAKVDWDEDTQAAVYTKGDRKVVFMTVEHTVWVNQTHMDTHAGALMNNGSRFIPVRLLSETLGCDVAYDGATQTVTITY